MTVAIPDEIRERRKIREVAREYRRAGYEVLVDPAGPQVPAFLGDYRPDLIAVGDRESVVIEVKSTRGFDRSEANREIAARVATEPGWRFELVVTGPRRGRQIEEQTPWDLPVVDGYLEQVRKLLEGQDREAAFLLLWANAEALLRRVALMEGVPISRLSPSQLVRELATQGVLERLDYVALDQAATFRNAFAHGMGAPEIEPALLDKLLGVIEALREDAESLQ
jgi:hypothetical protein